MSIECEPIRTGPLTKRRLTDTMTGNLDAFSVENLPTLTVIVGYRSRDIPWALS
jgi:hypothetical protein